MTYKNIRFEDSPVMRSLEKLAINKGLIKPETMEKTAQSKVPVASTLAPTTNFEENVMRLCAGLRSAGRVKQASEIETKFFNLKKAEHLYDTHGEKGEDVVNFAHPDGSHQMKGIEGDALIETTLDAHKAYERLVNKVPTGKNKQAHREMVELIRQAGKVDVKKNALNAIATILSSSKVATASMEDVQKLMQMASSETQAAIDLAERAGDLYGNTIVGARQHAQIVANAAINITNNSLEDAVVAINDISRAFTPNILAPILPDFLNVGLTNEQVNQAVQAKLSSARTRLEVAQKQFRDLSLHPENNQPKVEAPASGGTITLPEQEVVGSKVRQELSMVAEGLINKLNGWKPTLNSYPDPSDREQSLKWANTMLAAVKTVLNAMDQTPPEVIDSVAGNWKKTLTEYSKQVDQFYQTWVA